jgi:hypothetical protein
MSLISYVNINFENINVNREIELKYLFVTIEGTLQIHINNDLHFDEPEVMLVELAGVITDWLADIRSNKNKDFIYETMDHNEPILKFNYFDNECYQIDSIWAKMDGIYLLPKYIIIAEFENYLKTLEDSLKKTMNIDLEEMLNFWREF